MSVSAPVASATVLAVLVLYERQLGQVPAWPYLRQQLTARSASALHESKGFILERVLIYDNSPTPQARPDSLSGLTYVHDPANGGTAAAYVRACDEAREAGIAWLLLLDHDTSIPLGFIEAATDAYEKHGRSPRALLPWVFHGAAVVSPARVTRLGTIEPLQYCRPAPMAEDLTGISSGSIVHAATLTALMPFPSFLWLDYVDHWIFMQLRSRALPVTGFDASLQHDLSVSDIRTLSAQRLSSVLDGEALFVTLLPRLARIVYPLRLLARAIRYARTRPALARQLLIRAAGRCRGRA